MPRASSGALVGSVNVATVWFSFCHAEALRDTAGERLAAVQTQKDHAFPADFPETLHDALYVPGDGEVNEAWSQRLSVAAWELPFTLAALAGDMVIEANFHPHSELEVDRLRGLGDRVVEVHCACPAEVAVARYNARSRNEVHWVKTATLTTMDKYDRPVGIGSLITVDTTVPVDVASVAAEVRRLHASRTG
jgi:hypothetical protein